MLEGILLKDRVVIWDVDKAKNLFNKKSFGKLKDDRLELALIEAAYLLDKKKISIKGNGKMRFSDFFEYCKKIDPRFKLRYSVYKDLRDKKLPTRSGFKFGCDFRVYSKGANPMKRGQKKSREHTKYIVYAVSENYECSFAELSRAVRLAHNIRANMLWAVVGNDIKYFSVEFFKP